MGILRADSADPVKNAVLDEYFVDFNEAKALGKMPYRYNLERTLIAGFKKHSNNYLGAIMKLNKTMRNLYVHAYQSFLWNTVVSIRMSEYPRVVRRIIRNR